MLVILFLILQKISLSMGLRERRQRLYALLSSTSADRIAGLYQVLAEEDLKARTGTHLLSRN
jgi:hypothetical protein